MNRPKLMGILNLTPDSFTNDGVVSADEAVLRFEQLLRDGADMIDLGAESTRPGATALSAEEEWQRLGPVLETLVLHPSRDDVQLSVDTYHPTTAARAVEMGVNMVNDVSGLRADAMVQAMEAGKHCIVVMHSLVLPVDPEITWAADTDAVAEILRWKQAILKRAEQSGIDSTRLMFDPGIGFGKTPKQSLSLVLQADELVASGGRWLIGHSRKSFLKLFSVAEGADRDDATLMASAVLVDAGVAVLRVHNVARHRALLDGLCT